MAEYRKIDWQVRRVNGQLYIQDNVVRKPRFEEDPEIEYGHSRQGELNRERRRNKEFAQAMNRRYIGFLLAAAVCVFFAAAVYLSQIASTDDAKQNVQTLQSQIADLKAQNDETQSRMDASVNPEQIRQTAMDELGMVYAGQDQILNYDYEESDYVRQYEEIPGR